MRERHAEAVLLIAPLERTLTPLPLHRVWLDAIDGAQAHLVEFPLLGHTLDRKGDTHAVLHTLHAKVEPCAVVAGASVR